MSSVQNVSHHDDDGDLLLGRFVAATVIDDGADRHGVLSGSFGTRMIQRLDVSVYDRASPVERQVCYHHHHLTGSACGTLRARLERWRLEDGRGEMEGGWVTFHATIAESR